MYLLFRSLSKIVHYGTISSIAHCESSKIYSLSLSNKAHLFTTSLIGKQNAKVVTHLKKKKSNYWKYIAIGFSVGAVASVGYMYLFYKKINVAIPNQNTGQEYILTVAPPKMSISRSIRNVEDKTGLRLCLYQFQTCPFCCKVRAFLDYYGFSYDVIEVNSVTHKQTKWSTYRKVPFLIVQEPGSELIFQLKDSSMIISVLKTLLIKDNASLEDTVKGYPLLTYADPNGKIKTDILNKYSLLYGEYPENKSKEDILSERRWRQWVDDVYVHLLSPNVYRSLKESFQSFEWFSKAGNWEELFSTWERLLVIYVGSFAMYFIGKALKKKYGLYDDVRLSLYEETRTWLNAIDKNGGRFLGGAEPNLCDLSVYGVLSAIEGCDAFHDLVQNTNLETWYLSMREVVQHHGGSKYLTRLSLNKT